MSAHTLPIPAARPIATIEVPDDWHALSTHDGVEGSTADGAVRLAVQSIQTSDLEGAAAIAVTKLAQSGVVLAKGTRHVATRRYNGLDALKINYSGTDPKGNSQVVLILVAMPKNSEFVAICYWGDGEAEESVGNDLLSIADSLELAK